MFSLATLLLFASVSVSDSERRPVGGCEVKPLSLLDEPTHVVTAGTYPLERLRRPATLPRGIWSLSIAAAHETNTLSGPWPGFLATLEVAFAPSCRVELGILTYHRVGVSSVPVFEPFALIVPRARFGLLPGGLAFEIRALIPTRFVSERLYGGVSLGLPTRLIIGRSLAVVALDQVLLVTSQRFRDVGASVLTVVSLLLPVGLLFQTAERLAFELSFRPEAHIASYGVLLQMTVSLATTITLAPRADLTLVGSTTSWSGGLVAAYSLGLTVRL